MKAELTQEGIWLVAQCDADDAQLAGLYSQGHLHLVCKAIKRPARRHGYKATRGRVLLTVSVAGWTMQPLGKRHTGRDARRKP